MRFGRNKTRKRVIVKIIFVWLLSIAMSLPLSLMYSKVSNPLKQIIDSNKTMTFKYIDIAMDIFFLFLLMLSFQKQDHASVLVDGTCQIPDPVYKLVGSIVCFYIPLGVMLITYCLTVRLLARQHQSLCGGGPTPSGTNTTNGNQQNGWGSGWLGQQNLGINHLKRFLHFSE